MDIEPEESHLESDLDRRTWKPTFTGSRQERAWIRDSLGGFREDRWFTDVLYRAAGGKEATVYCCRAHPSTGLDLIAAKVFRPRMFRAMRNDHLYKMGRGFLDADGKYVRDSRSARALRKKTRFGRRLDSASWCHHEVKTLRTLHAAGADVPRLLASSENAILMEFVGDERGPAPTLQTVRLPRGEAHRLFRRMIRNVEIMLAERCVHADLSAYNVLHRYPDVRVIDFPQTVDADRHPAAFELFARDVDRLCRYFVRQGVNVEPVGLAYELWSDAVP
jgi:RIO kinase 1